MEDLKLLRNQAQIKAEVERIAEELRRDYHGKHPLFLAVLKGSFVFLADLVRTLRLPVEVEFIRLSSYGKGTETSGRIRMVQGLRTPVRGRDVVVVEDIVDSGLTLDFLLGYLRRRRPASLRVCAFIDKRARRQVEVPLDYVGVTLSDEFVVGYGLDYAEQYRYLSELWALKEEAVGKRS